MAIKDWTEEERRVYRRNHARIKGRFGSASNFPCAECGSPARDWAQTRGTDGSDNEHFRPMCRSCHVRYDGIAERNAEGRWATGLKRGKFDEDHSKKLSEAAKRTQNWRKARMWRNQYGSGLRTIDPD